MHATGYFHGFYHSQNKWKPFHSLQDYFVMLLPRLKTSPCKVLQDQHSVREQEVVCNSPKYVGICTNGFEWVQKTNSWDTV